MKPTRRLGDAFVGEGTGGKETRESLLRKTASSSRNAPTKSAPREVRIETRPCGDDWKLRKGREIDCHVTVWIGAVMARGHHAARHDLPGRHVC